MVAELISRKTDSVSAAVNSGCPRYWPAANPRRQSHALTSEVITRLPAGRPTI